MKCKLNGLFILLLAISLILTFGVSGATAAAKDTIKVRMWTRITTLDTWNTQILADANVAYQILEPLYEIHEKTFRPSPRLAVSHKLIDDLTWEFELRKGVTFHNGEPFNAAAVKYTMERVLEPERKLYDKPVWEKLIERVDIVDDYTVRIITKKPLPIFLEHLTGANILPPKYTEEKGDAYVGENPIGTGPYRFSSWKRGEEIIFEANDNYWGEKPAIKNVVFRIIPEPAVSTAELITGGVDVVCQLGSEQIRTVNKSKKAAVLQAKSNRVHFIQFDSIARAGNSPCNDLKVRQAIYHAIDRQAIIDKIRQGYGVMLHGPLYPTYFGFDSTVEDIEPKYDPEKAKKLLAEAGYPDGFEADLSAYDQKEVYEAVQGFLRKIGIKTKLHWYGADIGTLIKLRNAGKVKDMGAYSWGGNIYDPDSFLPYWYTLNVTKNYMNDVDIDKWLAEAGGIFDQKKRAELYSKVQRRVVEKAYWVPVFGGVSLYGVSKDLDLATVGETPLIYRSSWK